MRLNFFYIFIKIKGKIYLLVCMNFDFERYGCIGWIDNYKYFLYMYIVKYRKYNDD